MVIAARQSMWNGGFNPLDYCFISRYNCRIITDFYAQYTANIGVEAVILFTKELRSATGCCIFGHSGSESRLSDSQDFRLLIHASYPDCGMIFDRGNGRAFVENFNILNTNWHKVSFQGRSNVIYDKSIFATQTSATKDSANCKFNFFGWPNASTENQQNDVAIRYVRIYNISTGQDLAYFVPNLEGMYDLVADKVYTPVNADARFEVVKWKSLSKVEEWKN